MHPYTSTSSSSPLASSTSSLQVFDKFLLGETLEEVYEAVGAVANKWLDMLETKGKDMSDEDLVELISEATTMSKSLEEYGSRKSCPTTCAARLGAFIGGDLLKDKGVKAGWLFIISSLFLLLLLNLHPFPIALFVLFFFLFLLLLHAFA